VRNPRNTKSSKRTKPDDKWQEAIANIFEREFLDETEIIMTGLLIYEATRHSYPHLDTEDVIRAVASHLWVALNLRSLVDQGKLKKFRGADGQIHFIPNPDSANTRFKILK
jgi:hypothetical protein